MYDMDSKLRKFYVDEVAIASDTRKKLRDARKTNESRLEGGLAKAKKPAVLRHVQQGGYRMKTVVQHPDNTYDIDNGAAFSLESLRSDRGADMAALDARKMVCSALQDDRFNTPPEVRNHCVRVYYNEGWWVDVPVYRQIIDANANAKATRLEIASTDWKPSDPEGVTAWFENLEKTKSPDADKSGDPQFRRIVAYIKALAKGRKTWNMPTGFMISVLVSEMYHRSDRDDVALRRTLEGIRTRLLLSLVIPHPKIQGEQLNRGAEDVRCVNMRDRLGELLEHLKPLDDPKCTADDGARGWDRVYGVTYFKESLKETAPSKAAAYTTFAASSQKFVRGDGGRYG